jgi:hypothetical protein
VAAIIIGVVAAAALPWSLPGIGWLVTGVAATVAAVSIVVAYGPRPRTNADAVDLASRTAWGLATLGLLAVGAIRAAAWLFVLCVLTATVTGTLALAGGRTLRGLFLGIMAGPIAVLRAMPWGYRTGVAVRGHTGNNAIRTAAAVVVGIGLLLLFGSLLAGADAAFARVLDNIFPTINAGVVSRWVFTFILFTLVMLAAAFLALAPPRFDGEGSSRRRRLRRIEWALPVGALVVLFAGFVAVQATVLFGGWDHVLRTVGLTSAEYARSGFGQLITVTALTLGVLAVAAHFAARETVTDRVWLRGLLGALSVLTLVIVASALSRMWAYEQAYGFTHLRLLVSAFEIWLGVVFLLVMVAGIRLRARTWLPGAIMGSAVIALLAIAVLNPDRFIAERNIDRFDRTGYIDLYYLEDLGADAVPALDQLREPYRSCVLHEINADLEAAAAEEEWRHWNLARTQARAILADYASPFDARNSLCSTIDWSNSP